MATQDTETDAILSEALALIDRSGFPISAADRAGLKVNDFGLGHPREEGFVFVDLLLSPRVRVTLMALLPNQTLPQHLHPPYDGEPGKEETLRVLHGQAWVYVEGTSQGGPPRIPEGKEAYYTAAQGVSLAVGEQCTVAPGTAHWFQGGPEGAVCLAVQNRVDEMKNLFFDPASTGCPIDPPTAGSA